MGNTIKQKKSLPHKIDLFILNKAKDIAYQNSTAIPLTR